MDPHALVDQAAASGVPAPFWFVELFKVLGFVLHMVPMNLWFAGLLVALILAACGGEFGKRFAARLVITMPVIVALGINFGIVPLLFTQLAYNKVFYPATILMAWFWMGIIGLLIVAYYGVYVCMFGLRRQARMPGWRWAAGWIASLCFIAIGFLFANAMSLMDHPARWPGLWLGHELRGAALGTALNVSDAALWPRWLLMFGLALGTTASWSLVDAAWFAGREKPQYREWVQKFALRLYVLSVAWAGAAGGYYLLLAWPAELRQVMFGWPLAPLTAITAAAPCAPLVWLFLRREHPLGRTEASLVGLAQVGVLAVNAISRQVVQNVELKPLLDVAQQPTATQWSPLIVFLTLFVVGLAVVAWMLAQVVKAESRSET